MGRSDQKASREAVKYSRVGDSENRFDPAADVRRLREQYSKLSRRAFQKLLDDLIEKYEIEEAAAVHAALVEKARSGDLTAIRLYRESQADMIGEGGVTIIDDI